MAETLTIPNNSFGDSSGKKAIVFDDVYLAFDHLEVLCGVSFDLEYGETKALFGVAGSGKSTILKLALGLIRPDAGRIFVLGQDISVLREEELFELRSRIGMVFQESALFDSLKVRENVAFRLYENHVSESEIIPRVREALEFVELGNTINQMPAELSGGMRRRVSIARAIISKPELLLYDSPTGGLDPITSTTIIELIMKQRDVFHTSALLVTHRLQDAFILASHIYDNESRSMKPIPKGSQLEDRTSFLILKEGKVIFDGDAHALAQNDDEYIKEYIA